MTETLGMAKQHMEGLNLPWQEATHVFRKRMHFFKLKHGGKTLRFVASEDGKTLVQISTSERRFLGSRGPKGIAELPARRARTDEEKKAAAKTKRAKLKQRTNPGRCSGTPDWKPEMQRIPYPYPGAEK